LRRLNVLPHRRHAAGIERDRNDCEITVLQFVVDALPDWQVESASSPGRP
jgi:hypothetical protein